MHFEFVAFLLVLSSLNLQIQLCVSAKDCTDSQATARTVDHCPKTEKEWREASRRKNCSQFNQSCTAFVYHCVINEWEDENIEVCAAKKIIVGKACAEFNKGGNRIQRHSKAPCTTCPMVYSSIDSYKYQECFEVVSSKRSTKPLDTHISLQAIVYDVYKTSETVKPTQELLQNGSDDSKVFGKNKSSASGLSPWVVVFLMSVLLIMADSND